MFTLQYNNSLFNSIVQCVFVTIYFLYPINEIETQFTRVSIVILKSYNLFWPIKSNRILAQMNHFWCQRKSWQSSITKHHSLSLSYSRQNQTIEIYSNEKYVFFLEWMARNVGWENRIISNDFFSIFAIRLVIHRKTSFIFLFNIWKKNANPSTRSFEKEEEKKKISMRNSNANDRNRVLCSCLPTQTSINCYLFHRNHLLYFYKRRSASSSLRFSLCISVLLVLL